MNLTEKFRETVNWAHDRGFPLPLARNTDGKPSVSLTMMILSFAFCLTGLLQKLNDGSLDIDMSQALTLFGLTSALYFSRRVSDKKKSDGAQESEVVEEEVKE